MSEAVAIDRRVTRELLELMRDQRTHNKEALAVLIGIRQDLAALAAAIRRSDGATEPATTEPRKRSRAASESP